MSFEGKIETKESGIRPPKRGDYIQARVKIPILETRTYTGIIEKIRKGPRGDWINLSTGQTFPARSMNGMTVEIKFFDKVKNTS